MREARSGNSVRLLAVFASLILASCGGTPAPSGQPPTAVALTDSEPTRTAGVTETLPTATPSARPTAAASAAAPGAVSPTAVASSSPSPDGGSTDGSGDGGSADDGTGDAGSGDDGTGTAQGGPPTGPGREGVDWVSTAVQPAFYDAAVTPRGVVAVGEDQRGGVIWLSATGTDWTVDADDSSLDSVRLNGVAGDGSTTVAIGCDVREGTCRSGGIWVRTDAWRRAATASAVGSAVLVDVATDHGTSIAIGSDYGRPVELVSTDRTSWTRVPLAKPMDKAKLSAITMGAKAFVMVGTLDRGPAAWTSTDGSTWKASHVTNPTDAITGSMSSVVRDGGAILAAGAVEDSSGDENAAVWRSTDDGATWSPISKFSFDDTIPPFTSLAASADGTVGLSDDTTMLSTDGGVTWTAGSPDWGNIHAVVNGSKGFIAVGENHIWASPRVAMKPPLDPLGSSAPQPPPVGWSPAPAMPALAPGFTGAPDGRGAIVIFSAADGAGMIRVDRYTPGDPGKWKRLASIAAGIRDPHAVNDKGTIYLVGLTIDGRHGRTVAYHPKTGRFNAVEGMPTPREHPAVTVGAKDGAIYVLGGRASPCCDHVTSNGALATVERFDPHTGHWTRRSPMPWPDTHPSAASVGSTVYLFLPARVWMYDPAGDRWKAGPANLSYGTMGQATAGPDGLIRVFSCTRYDLFDPAQGHWQPGLALMTPRCDPLVATDGVSQMYVFGGEYSGDPGRVVESANAGGG